MLSMRNVVIYANWTVEIGVTSWPQLYVFHAHHHDQRFFLLLKIPRLHINSSLAFANYIISTRMCQGQLSYYQALMRVLPTILSHFSVSQVTDFIDTD